MKHKPIVITYGLHHDRKFSGHIYELIDYYIFFLKHHFREVYIWLPSNLHRSFFEKVLRYRVKKKYLQLFNDYLLKDTSLLKSSVVISCDGFIYPKSHKIFICDTFIAMRCDKDYLRDFVYANHKLLLQDSNLYNDTYPGFDSTIHYVKKIYYDVIAYEKHHYSHLYHTYLLYINHELKVLKPLYRQFCLDHDVLIVAPPGVHDVSHKIAHLPLPNIFALFKSYVYVNPINNFDCSPRFILECKYFNKNVVFLETPPSSTLYRYRLTIDETDLAKDSLILDIISNYV